MSCIQPFRDDSAQLLLYKIASCIAEGGSVAGVSSFNGLAGAVTFTGADIITLLGCTPACEGDVVNSFNTRVGDVTLTLADVSTVADSRYVLKAGDTMTGLLTINTAANAFAAISTDAGTTNATTTSEIFHRTSGVPAVGFGARFNMNADTVSADDQLMLRIESSWTDAATATRTSQTQFILPVGGSIQSTLILTNGQIQARNGLAASPSFTTQGDTDTGIFFNGSNDVFISAGGVQVLAASDTVGIIFNTSFSLPYVAKVATYTASAADYTIDCTSGTFDVDLPTAVGITGRIYVVKNSGVGTITIDPSGAELIDSLATATVVSGGATMIQSTGAGWIII